MAIALTSNRCLASAAIAPKTASTISGYASYSSAETDRPRAWSRTRPTNVTTPPLPDPLTSALTPFSSSGVEDSAKSFINLPPSAAIAPTHRLRRAPCRLERPFDSPHTRSPRHARQAWESARRALAKHRAPARPPARLPRTRFVLSLRDGRRKTARAPAYRGHLPRAYAA